MELLPCVCRETTCPHHPSNHDQGCDPCVTKNLRLGEIPACFFRLIDDDLSQLTDFKVADFVKFYLEHQKL